MAEKNEAAAGQQPEQRRAAPDAPTQLDKPSWKEALRRAMREFKQDDLTLLAAGLTYYAVLSLFPALLVLISLLGLLGASATQSLIDNLAALTPGAARDVVTKAIGNLQHASGTAGIAFVLGLLGALWSASGYVGGFIKASNIIYEVDEGRPFWKLRPAADRRHGAARDRRRADLGVDRGDRTARPPGRGRHRAGRHRRDDVEHRQVAGDRVRRLADDRLPVLGGAQRSPARLSVDQPRRDLRRRGVGGRVGGVRLLRRELRGLQQDLRQPGRRHHLPRLAVDHQPRDPPRRRAQRRARAPARDRARPPARRRAVPARAR